MSDGPKTLEALVAEARELEPYVIGIQAKLPTTFTDERIHWVQDRYHTWNAEALTDLPEEYRQRFHACFIGQIPETPALPGLSIRTFMADPAATREDIDILQIFQRNRPPRPLVWKYPYAVYFLPGFRQQVAILNEARAWLSVHAPSMSPVPTQTSSHTFHSEVLAAAGRLFQDGHYRQAILEASIALIHAVAKKANLSEVNGAAGMQHVFSKNDPILHVVAHAEEQQGYMQLFAGMVGAVRNTAAHPKPGDPEMDLDEALEWLGFLSALFRVLDRAEKVEPQRDSDPSKG